MDSEAISKLTESTRLLLQRLTPLEASILKQSFGIDTVQVEDDRAIADSLDIPVEFVAEYKARALRKLRHPSASDRLREFLEQKPSTEKHINIVVPKAIEEVEELTPDLVDRLRTKSDDISRLKPHIFEHLVAELLASRNFYNVKLVGRDAKTSADVFAAKYIDDVGEHRYFVEVKRWKDRVGVEVIDRVYGARIAEQPTYGWTATMVVSIVGFKQFRKYSVDDIHNMGIYLKDRDDLLMWLEEYEENDNGLFVPPELGQA